MVGPHDALDQYRAVLEYQALFADEVVLIIDDFQCSDVQVCLSSLKLLLQRYFHILTSLLSMCVFYLTGGN